MAQNIYDTAEFFGEYSKLPRSVYGLDGAPEWPTLRKLVGDVKGQRVLDLGCGFGWFARWAVQEGHARSVLGIDLSENMLNRARQATETAGIEQGVITYSCGNLEELSLKEREYDLAYSSLALHYLPDEALRRLLGEIFKGLESDGKFVFSIEHPIASAPFDASWKTDEEGRVFWPLNQYWDEGLRVTNWLAPGVKKYHRTVDTYLTYLIEAGFILTAFKEAWEGLDLKPKLEAKAEAHRPYFLLIAVKKP
ncbi:uncharacterized protein A1O9_03119 [Exophiala aquamarina CBS 119918]|uniref:Methyltransferase domain-containing protein n=1 Tax=Exophiala aquamarina CBS 119918 TaxID=1182545 RepID=A0A072PP74_9EURO|nr:uncharacterized protein A1O9_03119 [Exophiala aquamarina CBS 119918]KEF61552.1 hypothetical protein A1O9_03119 [Exophiala aquamarina CBS 119918]